LLLIHACAGSLKQDLPLDLPQELDTFRVCLYCCSHIPS